MITSSLFGRLEKFGRWGRPLREILFLNLGDDRMIRRRRLLILIENGGVTVTMRFRFLSHETAGATRRYPLAGEGVPSPEVLASAVALGVSDLKAGGVRATLVIPSSWAIVKQADFPSVVRENLSDVISYELDRLTPLSPESALYDFQVLSEDADRIHVRLFAAKGDTIHPYLEALGEKGIAIHQVAVSDSKEVNLLDKGRHHVPKPPLALTFVLLAILAALGFFWLVSPLQIEERRIAAIDAEISSRKEEVGKIESLKKARDGVEQEISDIRSFNNSRPLLLDLLREMTRVLPKNAWLSRVRFTESTVEIEGYAASATDIVPKLEASRYFSRVEFSSPTFRDVRLNADRFVIKMELDGLPGEKVDREKSK